MTSDTVWYLRYTYHAVDVSVGVLTLITHVGMGDDHRGYSTVMVFSHRVCSTWYRTVETVRTGAATRYVRTPHVLRGVSQTRYRSTTVAYSHRQHTCGRWSSATEVAPGIVV